MSEQQEAPRVVPKWIGVVGLFIAPTTVITSLCYFYGYVATRKYFAYFGIDTDAIGFTTSDYVMRSVRALYVPVIAGLLTYVALLWAGPYLRRLVQSARRTRLVRTLGWAAVAVGAVSTAWAIVSLTLPQGALVHIDALTPVALGLGAAFLGVGVWMLTSSQTPVAPTPFAAAHRASLVVAAAAIVLALFWITDILAVAYGEDQAENHERPIVVTGKQRCSRCRCEAIPSRAAGADQSDVGAARRPGSEADISSLPVLPFAGRSRRPLGVGACPLDTRIRIRRDRHHRFVSRHLSPHGQEHRRHGRGEKPGRRVGMSRGRCRRQYQVVAPRFSRTLRRLRHVRQELIGRDSLVTRHQRNDLMAWSSSCKRGASSLCA